MWEYDFEIATNSESDISVSTLMGVMDLKAKGYNFIWRVKGGGGYARTRNILAYDFLKEKKAPYMLIIDRDIVFKSSDIDRLLEAMRSGYHLVGGCYPVKDGTRLATSDRSITIDGNRNEVQWLSTGFGAISRELLLKMVDKLHLPIVQKNDWSEAYPFFEDHRYKDKIMGWMFLSEDYNFCMKARKVGVTPYLDTKILLGHIGNKVYGVADVVKHVNTHNLSHCFHEEGTRIKDIAKDVSEFFSESIEEAKTKIESIQCDQSKEWEERTGSVEDFYRDSTSYIYDGAKALIAREDRVARYIPLINIRGAKILDIGCGIGSAVTMLAEQGNEVLGYDIGKPSIDFCNFRKKKYNLKGEFTTQRPDDLSKFDIVLAMDVLEHIENLESFLMELGKKLKPGCKLYHLDNFKDYFRPMHFDFSNDIDQWLRNAGFALWDEKWAVKL